MEKPAPHFPNGSTANPSLIQSKSALNWLPWALGGVAILLLAVLWPYQHADASSRMGIVQGMLRLVAVKQDWMYCPAVPFIAGWLIWRRREDLAKIPLQGTHWAWALIAFAAFTYWVGYKADTRYFGFAATQIFIAGGILLIGGKEWFKALFFPWLFLSFTWPFPPLEERLAVPLRHMSVFTSAHLLNLVGISVVKRGTAIFSAEDAANGLQEGAKFSLDVENPCSGINSLFALIMIAALFGYLSVSRSRDRWIVFFSAIPLAMLGNLLRIVLLAVGSLFFGSEFAVGKQYHGELEMSTFHTLAGFLGFGLALFGMFSISRWLESFSDKQKPTQQEEHVTPPASPKSNLIRAGAFVMASAGVIGLCAATPVALELSEPGIRMELPVTVSSFVSKELPMSPQEKRVFEEGVELNRRLYSNSQGEFAIATVVLSGPITRSLHQPHVCLPGQGWKIASTKIITIPFPPGKGEPIKASMIKLYRDREENGQRFRTHAYNIFWYEGYDVITPTYSGHIIASYRDSVFRQINHRWGMASIFNSTPEVRVGHDNPFAEILAEESLKNFTSIIAPELILRR